MKRSGREWHVLKAHMMRQGETRYLDHMRMILEESSILGPVRKNRYFHFFDVIVLGATVAICVTKQKLDSALTNNSANLPNRRGGVHILEQRRKPLDVGYIIMLAASVYAPSFQPFPQYAVPSTSAKSQPYGHR